MMKKNDEWKKRHREYIASPQWKAKKAAFRTWCEKKGIPFVCVGCGCLQVQVHHRTYIRLGDEDMRDLIPLCKSCHEAVHEVHKKKKIALVRTDLALREVHGWEKEEAVAKLLPFGRVKSGKSIKESKKTKAPSSDFLATKNQKGRVKKYPKGILQNHSEIRSMAKAGYTAEQIARTLKLDVRKLSNYLKEWG